ANESLIQGQLDVNIQSNYTGRYEAGEDIHVNVTIENTGSYFAVDVDGSDDITEDDILVVDDEGSEKFSKSSDTVLAGQSPPDGASLQNTNPWKEPNGGNHSVAMYDSSTGPSATELDDWDPSADIIVRDFNSGGTVSRSSDVAMNTGDNNEINTEPGQNLNPIDGLPDDLFFPSQDTTYNPDTEVVRDTDDDGRLTAMPDPIIAGQTPSQGEDITFNDTVPPRMDIASYNTGDDSFNSNDDLIVFDKDNDSQYTQRPDEEIYSGSAIPPEAPLRPDHIDAWNDEDKTSAAMNDLEIYDADQNDNNWNASEDLIWIESGTNNGYQSSEDDKLIGTSTTNAPPTQVNSLFEQWPNVSAYDAVSGGDFNKNVDGIIHDYNSGETYSPTEDSIINGSLEGSSFSADESLTRGFPDSWRLDVIEGGISEGDWNEDRDTILRDRYQGGTYSAQADEIVNSGGSNDSSEGKPLKRLSNSLGAQLRYSDLDNSNSYTTGDEIFRDLDDDNQYTNQSDQQLAGLSLEVAGEGTGLETSNEWQTDETGGDDQTPLLFYDITNPGNWDSNHDAIIHDTDQDDFFTGRSDRVIEGDPSLGENGDTLILTEPPEISAPDVKAKVTVGTNTTGPLELARTESGTYRGEITIPDVPDSRMLLQVTAETPISNMRGMESKELMTRAQGIGFDTNETSIDLDVQKRGNYTRSVKVDNLLTDQNSVNISLSDSIENMTSASVNQISLESEGNSSVEFDFNISEMEDSEGEII
ncbi:MAG: hypothetical protein J07AB43_11750, partial [Candidatus Nanosalina sp. J07AB43]